MIETIKFSDFLSLVAVLVAITSLIFSLKRHFKSQQLSKAEKLTLVLENMAIRNIKLSKLESLLTQKILTILEKIQGNNIDKGELENALESFKIIKNIRIESQEWIRELSLLNKMDDVGLETMLGRIKISIQRLEKDIKVQKERFIQLTKIKA